MTFPSLEFASERTRFVTRARQITVSAPQRSEEMELVFTPGKHRVYAGEPLRLDVRWSCMLGTKRIACAAVRAGLPER